MFSSVMLSAWATRPLIKAKPEIVGGVMKYSCDRNEAAVMGEVRGLHCLRALVLNNDNNNSNANGNNNLNNNARFASNNPGTSKALQ
jgi:hypothetical protein